MNIDTSALLAILRAEPEARACAQAIEQAAIRRISAANLLETAIVVDASRDPIASRRLDDLLTVAGIVIEPVTEAHVRIGRDAYWDFRRHSTSTRRARALTPLGPHEIGQSLPEDHLLEVGHVQHPYECGGVLSDVR
jgi:uncharacterized protein with PIN domain